MVRSIPNITVNRRGLCGRIDLWTPFFLLFAQQCAARNPSTYEGRDGGQCCGAAKRPIQFLLVSEPTSCAASPSQIFAEHLDLAPCCECACSARSDSRGCAGHQCLSHSCVGDRTRKCDRRHTVIHCSAASTPRRYPICQAYGRVAKGN